MPVAKRKWRVKDGDVNNVLRKDGTVVTITPTGEHYDLTIDGEHRTIGPEMAADPLADPEFDALVREVKKDLDRLSSGDSAPADKPNQPH
jgi:hypothetical protein